jgi:hypothetical protein
MTIISPQDLKYLFSINSFSDTAYYQQKIAEDEIDNSLKMDPNSWTPPQNQPEALILNALPHDVVKMIFTFMDKKNLQTCLLVCKEFSLLAKSIYVQIAFQALSQDFKKVESNINLLLNEKFYPLEIQGNVYRCHEYNEYDEKANSFPSTSPMHPGKFDCTAGKLTLFKKHCASLYNNMDSTTERQQIRDILKLSLQLLKACHQKQAQEDNVHSHMQNRLIGIFQETMYKQ